MPLTGQTKRDYQRQWLARRRAEFFADKQCVRCGSTEDLQLDHIDPETKVDHRIWSWSTARREAEIAKCQVLCEPCHKAKTWDEDFERAQHGTISKYTLGCKCDPCSEAGRVARRKYKR